jgi:hypothetical protein
MGTGLNTHQSKTEQLKPRRGRGKKMEKDVFFSLIVDGDKKIKITIY